MPTLDHHTAADLLRPDPSKRWGNGPKAFLPLCLGVGVLVVSGGCGGKSSETSSVRRVDDNSDAGRPTEAVASSPTPSQASPPPPPQRPPSRDEVDLEVFDDPGCPEDPGVELDYNCDPLLLDDTTCPPAFACFPYVEYPSRPCEPEIYGTRCEPTGSGTQGDDCSFADCAAGHLCVATGQGTKCAQLCELPGAGKCPAGLICGNVDIEGYGVCF